MLKNNNKVNRILIQRLNVHLYITHTSLNGPICEVL